MAHVPRIGLCCYQAAKVNLFFLPHVQNIRSSDGSREVCFSVFDTRFHLGYLTTPYIPRGRAFDSEVVKSPLFPLVGGVGHTIDKCIMDVPQPRL